MKIFHNRTKGLETKQIIRRETINSLISFFAKYTNYLLEMNSYEYQCVFQPSAFTAMKTGTKKPMATWPREKLLLSLSVSHTHIGPLPSPCSNVTKLEEDPQKIGVTHSLTQ